MSIIDLEGHLSVMITIEGPEEARRCVDVLLKCESCFAVLDNLTEIRTTERGLAALRREGVIP